MAHDGDDEGEQVHSRVQRLDKAHKMSQCMEKEFKFPPLSGLLPLSGEEIFSDPSFIDDELYAMKTRLNSVKASLSELDLSVWCVCVWCVRARDGGVSTVRCRRVHASCSNPTGGVVRAVRRLRRAELVTVAWCKFYELVYTYSVVPPACEATGRLRTCVHGTWRGVRVCVCALRAC